MAAPFLPQAQPVYPGNANLAPQLALLGDTIGQGIAGYRKQSLLGDVLKSGANPNDMALKLLQAGMPKEASILATMANQQAQQAFQQQQLGLQDRQVGVSEGQLKVAQGTAAITQAQGAAKLKILNDIMNPQPGTLLQPPPVNDPTMSIRPLSGPGDAPVGMPQTAALPSFSDRFAPAVMQPGTARPVSTTSYGGLPRDEMALSVLGMTDAAKALREQRKGTPEAILADVRSKKTAEQTVESELARPVAEAKARESIEGISKAASESIRLASHGGLNSAVGPVDQWIPAIRDQTANFRADLDTLSTKVFITAINRMRELSKTGGALGSVTEKEIAKMENSMRSLSIGQGQGNMRRNLGLLASDFNDSMANIASAYKAQYGKSLPYTPIKIPDKLKDPDKLNGGTTTAGNVPPPPPGFVRQ